MAQQAISQRELSGNWAGNRRAPTLGIGGKPPTNESAANQAAFAQDLEDFGDDLQQGRRRRAAEEKAEKDAQKIKDDAEAERLKIKAKRRELESSGQDYKTAHGISVLDSGEPGQKARDQGDPDVMNPIYRKEYERAYTDRKVKNFQTKLNARAKKEQREVYNVWKQGFRKGPSVDEEGNEIPPHPAYGLSFEDFAAEALSRRKDDIFANELSHLPHLGEFADKISFEAHTDEIAILDQEFRDETKHKFLDGQVNTHLESFAPEGRSGLPRTQTKSGKEISAASDLLNKTEGLMGKQVTEDGQLRGIYSKNEVHGAFLKEFNNRLLLADDPNDPIFTALGDIFDSPDAHRLLELDPNNPNGIGSQYGNLKEEYDKRYNQATTARESKNSALEKQLKEEHTQYINGSYSAALNLKTQAAKGNLDESQIAILERKLADTKRYDKGDQQFLDDTHNILIELRNPNIKTTVVPLTKEENKVVQDFISNLDTSIETLEDLGIEETKILSGKDNSRVQMAKLKALDAQKEALETRNAGKDRRLQGFKDESKNLTESKKNEYKKVADDIRNTERTGTKAGMLRSREATRKKKFQAFKDSVKTKKEAIDKNPKLTPEDKVNAKDALDAEIQSLQEEEDNFFDSQQSKSFYEYVQDPEKFNIEKITEANVKALQKKVGKINDDTLRETLSNKITDIRNGRSTQEDLKQDLANLKSFDKRWSKLGSALNDIKGLSSEDGLIQLRGLQKFYEQDTEFLEAAKLDPSKRNFLDEIVKTEKYLQDKLPQEEKERLEYLRDVEIRTSEEDRNTKQTSAQTAIKDFEEGKEGATYEKAVDAIKATYDHIDEDSGLPTTMNVFPDERRLALLDRLDDFKTKTSGQVPTISSPQFDPALYIDFEDQIKTLEGLEGTQLKEAINDIEKNLRVEYNNFKVPQQIYEDFQEELKSKIPGSPVTISPVVHGRKTIRSAFLGKFDKFDDNEEFLKLGGRTATNLYDKVRKVYERKITELVESPEFSNLTAVQKLAKAESVAGKLLNSELDEKDGGMDSDWRDEYRIYKKKYDDAQIEAEKQEAEKEEELKLTTTTTTTTGPQDKGKDKTTDSNLKSVTTFGIGPIEIYRNVQFQDKQANQKALQSLGIKNG